LVQDQKRTKLEIAATTKENDPDMMKIIFPILLLLNFEAFAEDTLYSSLLQKYVQTGRVNYKELCKNSDLTKYISYLESSDPEKILNEKDRLAFWINAYNAYTLKVICDHYPVKSINDLHSGGLALGSVFKTTIWDKEIVIINHKPTSLNNIEHKIIRPVFHDFRIHFALVCAAKSCPPLRSESFEGSNLDQQLDDQARLFLADNTKNRFDAANRKATISKIFDWYKKDFGKDEAEVLVAISKFLPEQIGRSIQSEPGKWQVDYTNYDWSLNE
jgi:Protein of unknown function, DUF547